MTDQFSKKAEAWSARFSEPVSDLVKRYTASVFFDKRMAKADIQGSLAHADMLAAQGIIPAADLTARLPLKSSLMPDPSSLALTGQDVADIAAFLLRGR